jgi:hypothetical protein
MSKFIIPCRDSYGNKTYFVTSPHKGDEAVKGYESVLMWLEKNGFRMDTNVSPAPEKPVESTTERHCQQCGSVMEYKTGTSAKSGKPWKGYFCTGPDKGHPVSWIK